MILSYDLDSYGEGGASKNHNIVPIKQSISTPINILAVCNGMDRFAEQTYFFKQKTFLCVVSRCLINLVKDRASFFNTGSDKRQYYRAALSVSSDAVSQFGDIFEH